MLIQRSRGSDASLHQLVVTKLDEIFSKIGPVDAVQLRSSPSYESTRRTKEKENTDKRESL